MSDGDSQKTPKKLRQLSIVEYFGSFPKKRKMSFPDANSKATKSSHLLCMSSSPPKDTIDQRHQAGDSSDNNGKGSLNASSSGNGAINNNTEMLNSPEKGSESRPEQESDDICDGSSQDSRDLVEFIMAEKRDANKRLLEKEYEDDNDLSQPTPTSNHDTKKKLEKHISDKLTMYDSPDMFDTYPTPDFDETDLQEEDGTMNWMGMPKSRLKTAPSCLHPLPELKSTQYHTVLFDTSYLDFGPPPPSKKSYVDAWDANHVRLPCSQENLFPQLQGNETKLINRWELIEKSLLSNITTSKQLEEAIKRYNMKFTQPFSALHTLLNEKYGPNEKNEFFSETLPGMIELALSLPILITEPVPLLKTQQGRCLTLSQQQIACLLCNAFFCTFPRRNTTSRTAEYSSYPTINFNRLLTGPSSADRKPAHIEKLATILHYFKRVVSEMPSGAVTFERQVCMDFPLWNKTPSELSGLHIRKTGLIEDEGIGMLQMDFANKYIGGGVLGSGLVQEEILFSIFPELLISRLFMEVMDDNECIYITGAERFSKYSGYASDYKWEGDYIDTNTRDTWRRKVSFIVAMDATHCRLYQEQFKIGNVRRELNKLYCGFQATLDPDYSPAIATGNWGCGAFGGDLLLKGLLQMMAAAVVCRDLCYMTNEDEHLMKTLHDMHRFITSAGLSVGDLWDLIVRYNKEEVALASKQKRPIAENIFEFMQRIYQNYETSTDDEDSCRILT